MNPADTLASLQTEGVTLLERDGQLFARPSEPLTEDQAATIRADRDALLREVRQRPQFIADLLALFQTARILPQPPRSVAASPPCARPSVRHGVLP